MSSDSAASSATAPRRLSARATVAFLWRLGRFAPRLLFANILIWGLYHTLPITLGLIAREFFNTLEGKVAGGIGIWGLLGLLVVVGATRAMLFLVGVVAWTTHLHTIHTLLRKNMLGWLIEGPGARALPDSSGEAVSRFKGMSRKPTIGSTSSSIRLGWSSTRRWPWSSCTRSIRG